MAANQEQIQAEIARQVADCATMGVEDMMNQLFGEKMGIISAAMETLAMEEDEDDEEEEPELTLALRILPAPLQNVEGSGGKAGLAGHTAGAGTGSLCKE